MSTAQESLTYVYAVARDTDALRELLTGLGGVDGAPVGLLAIPGAAPTSPAPPASPPASAPVAFVVSPVPRRDFEETALKEHFEDLRWLEDVARAHHDVVQAVATLATVLPLRMATVYQDDNRARLALSRQHHVFARRLAQLDAHTEYGVKIYLPASAAPSDDGTATDDGAAEAASPGKAYLRRRRSQHHAREHVYRQAQQAARAVEATAARHASERVSHAPQSGELAGPGENVLNDAYLVPDGHAQEFRAAVTHASEDFPEVLVEVTGPWAPYSFAMPAAEDTATGDPDVQEPAP
ncbi:GvpL/GvpF family gas vesicle protein [Streptomyces sp. NPDC093795]|uniref:GvpL/GvpF family gas vesicle protein n=1 Tax=Streptomyces sp. NPDC093795 TaxID=3366051 RepID=UPI00381082E0